MQLQLVFDGVWLRSSALQMTSQQIKRKCDVMRIVIINAVLVLKNKELTDRREYHLSLPDPSLVV